MITQQDIDDCEEDRLAEILKAYEQVKDLPDDPADEYLDCTPLDMVKEFATAMGHPLDEKWRFLSLSYELSLDKRLICYINPSSFAALVCISLKTLSPYLCSPGCSFSTVKEI